MQNETDTLLFKLFIEYNIIRVIALLYYPSVLTLCDYCRQVCDQRHYYKKVE